MQVGAFTVEVLSEGRFEIFDDGHINRSSKNKGMPSGSLNVEQQWATVGINPILIQAGQHNILLDAGLGWGMDAGSSYDDISNIITNLDIFGLTPSDITHVIFSHLHYDHIAGGSYTNSKAQTQPTFPNATYFVHEKEWEFALSQIQQEQKQFGAKYQLDDFYRLIANNSVRFLGGKINSIVPGVAALWTGGHTPGHQVISIHSQQEVAYYLGDLIPTEHQLNHYSMSQLDYNSMLAKKNKVQLLRTACQQDASLLFYHSLFSKIGRLEKDENKKYVLKDIK